MISFDINKPRDCYLCPGMSSAETRCSIINRRFTTQEKIQINKYSIIPEWCPMIVDDWISINTLPNKEEEYICAWIYDGMKMEEVPHFYGMFEYTNTDGFIMDIDEYYKIRNARVIAYRKFPKYYKEHLNEYKG